MPDPDFERLLKSVPVPERSPEYWTDFPRQVRSRLRAGSAATARGGRRPHRLAWGLAFACACVVGLASIAHWRFGSAQEQASALGDGKVLREMTALFPNRVRGVAEDQAGTHLLLSDQPDVPVSTPLWIEVRDGGQRQVWVTFSGQKLQIAGEEVEVLLGAQGNVTLAGNQLVWSSADSTRVPGRLRIQAHPLLNIPAIPTG